MTTAQWLTVSGIALGLTFIVGVVIGHWRATARYAQELRRLNLAIRRIAAPYEKKC